MNLYRRYAGLLLIMMLILSALSWTSCAPKVIKELSLVTKVAQGAPAPHSGWLLSDGAMTDLLECCEKAR